jgi:putative oxidoreductase
MEIYRRIASPAPLLPEWGLTVLRAVVGFTFFMHGWQKVFELGITGVVDAFVQMGVPLPAVTAPLVSMLELVGGAAILLGLGTRWLAILLALDMLGAIALAHLPSGFFAPNGVELPLLLLGGALALVLTGPGACAVDRLIARVGTYPGKDRAWPETSR